MSVVILLLALGIVVFGFALDFRASDRIFWFQRSGAVLVAAGVNLEYCHLGPPRRRVGFEYNWVTNIRPIFKVLGFVAVATGTIIWAYGDLPFMNS